jgi:hypothetical protein
MAIMSGENDGNKPKSLALRVTEGDTFQKRDKQRLQPYVSGSTVFEMRDFGAVFCEPAGAASVASFNFTFFST